jgi:hypothetical protein
MFFRALVCLVLPAVLTGCLAHGGVQNADPRVLSTYVQKKASVYETYATYVGPPIMENAGSSYFLRSFVDNETGAATHQLYVRTTYHGTDWDTWYRANSDEGRSLEFTSLEQDVEGCGGWKNCVYTEQFGITVSDAYMRERAGIGGSVKVYARSGNEAVLTLPPNYIQAQLLAIDPYPVGPGFAPAAVESEAPSE